MRIESAAADFTLRLADGRTVRLAGLDPVRNTAQHPSLAEDARARLASWLDGQEVRLQPLAAEPDRWNRWPALVFAAPGRSAETQTAPGPNRLGLDPGLSVALAMVDAGLARARPEPAIHACWASLVRAEAGARDAGLGLWADPYYAVREAADGGGLATAVGALALVQGQITRVGQGRSRIFVSLDGPAADFSLRLARHDGFILNALGLSADRLTGLTVRVRGFLDDRFGAAMDLVTADQIEVLAGPDDVVRQTTRPER